MRAAIRLTDTDGLAALSMRRLGADLGVEAMAIYHHFANKDALLDRMVEELVTGSRPDGIEDGDWQQNLRQYSFGLFAALTAHPALVPLLFSRSAVTAANLEVLESLMASLTGAGFDPPRALDLIYGLSGLVLVHAGLATGVHGGGEPLGEPGQTSRLTELPSGQYPLLAAAAEASDERSATARFAAAVDAMIAGFAQLKTDDGR